MRMFCCLNFVPMEAIDVLLDAYAVFAFLGKQERILDVSDHKT